MSSGNFVLLLLRFLCGCGGGGRNGGRRDDTDSITLSLPLFQTSYAFIGRGGGNARPRLCPLPLGGYCSPTCWPWATVNVLPICWPWATVNVLPRGESDSDPEDKGEGDLLPCANEGILLSLDTSDSYLGHGRVGHPRVLFCDPGVPGSLSSLCVCNPLAPPTVGDDGPDGGGSREGCRAAGRGSSRSPNPAAGVDVARGG